MRKGSGAVGPRGVGKHTHTNAMRVAYREVIFDRLVRQYSHV